MSFPCKGECSRNFFDPITHELIHNTDFLNDLCFAEVQEVCRHINCPLEYGCGESMSGADDLQDHGCLEALEALFMAQCIDTTTPPPSAKATSCCPELEMKGLPRGIQNKREGVFRKLIGVEAHGRPVYENDFEEFLYYFPNEMDWVVGRNYSGTVAGIASVENRGGCPETFTQWSYFDQGQWHFDHRITTKCRQLHPSKWTESKFFNSSDDSAAMMAIYGVGAAILFMGIIAVFRIISTYFFGKATLLQSSRGAGNRLYHEPIYYPPQHHSLHRFHEATPQGTYTPPPRWIRNPARTPYNTPTSSTPPYFDPTQGFSQHESMTRSRTHSRLLHERRSNTRFHPNPFNNTRDKISRYRRHEPNFRMNGTYDRYFSQPPPSAMYYPTRHSTYRPFNDIKPVQSEVSWTCGPSIGGDEILSEQSVRLDETRKEDDSEDMSRICTDAPPIPPTRKSTRVNNHQRANRRPLFRQCFKKYIQSGQNKVAFQDRASMV